MSGFKLAAEYGLTGHEGLLASLHYDPLVADALQLAYEVHKVVTRNDGVTPYLVHPLRVAVTVQDHNFPSRAAVALLHDTVEDVDKMPPRGPHQFTDSNRAYLIRQIRQLDDPNDLILAGVWWLTSPDKDGSSLAYLSREVRKSMQREKISAAPKWVQAIKLADRLDNLKEGLSSTDPFFAKDGKYWQESKALYLAMRSQDNSVQLLEYPWVRELEELLSS